MGISTASLIVVAQEYRGDLIHQINRKSVLLQMMETRPGQGQNAAWVPVKDGAYAETFTDGADVTTYGTDGQTAATLAFANYRANFGATDKAMLIGANSNTPQGNIRLWAGEMKRASEKLASMVNIDLYDGTGASNSIVGLSVAIDDANTYAGIDRTVVGNEYWQSYVIDPGAPTALTFDQVRLDQEEIGIACGETPDLALVHPSVFRKLGSLFDPLKKYDFSVRDVRLGAGDFSLQGGLGMIQFDGTYFISDKDCTENAIYYCNSRHMHMQVLAAANVPGMDVDVMPIDDGVSQMPLSVMLKALAPTGSAEKAFMFCHPQLVLERPNAFGKRLNISVA